jgi:hypothetical protein
MGMSFAYGSPESRDEQRSIATIDRALELGITIFDTADASGTHHNERLIGMALACHRSEVQLATKVGLVSDEPGRRVDGRPERRRRTAARSISAVVLGAVGLDPLGWDSIGHRQGRSSPRSPRRAASNPQDHASQGQPPHGPEECGDGSSLDE